MSAFNNVLNNVRSRNFGGTNSKYSCEPYISGYGFIKWYLPPAVSDYLQGVTGGIDTNDLHQTGVETSEAMAGKMLSNACVGVTPPNQTLDFAYIEGSCGVKFGLPQAVRYGDTLNIKYLEMSGTPIFKIHKAWFEMIRENKVGLLTPSIGRNHTSASLRQLYAGNVLYWTTKPDGCTVEFAALYAGVIPSRDPQDGFNFDISSVDKSEMDYEYHIDYIWTNNWVLDKAKKYAKEGEYGSKGATSWSGFVGRWGEGSVGSAEKK